MHNLSKELKQMARNQLSGKYGTFIGAYLLYLLTSLLSTNIFDMIFGDSVLNPFTITAAAITGETIRQTVIYHVATFILSLILSVFNIGLLKISLDIARGYPIHLQDILYGFHHHPDRAILAQFLLSLLMDVCILPGYLMIIYGYRTSVIVWLLVGSLLLLAGAILYLVLSLMFSQTMFFLTDYIDIDTRQAFKESIRLMKGKKKNLLYLQMSFLGIYLLGSMACGIGILWVIPYMHVTLTNFYRKATGEID